MKFTELMNEHAGAVDIGPVAPDAKGNVTLLFDGEHEVTFSATANGGVLFQCELGEASRLGDGDCRALLEATFSETGGAAFAIHRATGILLFWRHHGEFESLGALEKALNDFIGQTIAWKQKIASGDLGGGGAMNAPAAGAFPTGGSMGFLQV